MSPSRRTQPRSRWHRLPTCAFCLIVLTGCVTERRPLSASSPGQPTANAPRETTPATQSPREPLNKPAENQRTISSRILVGVQPIGSVPYDAQVLPLISPNGNFLATQVGDAPSWPTLLAEPGATPPLTTKLRLYDLSGSDPREITPQTPLPSLLLLGRSADSQGFLVESPRPDGARWIGRVNWQTGALTWLIKNEHVNAHATLNTKGDLVWLERSNAGERTLCVLHRSGGESRLTLPARTTHAVPVFTNDPTTLYTFEINETGITVAARPLFPSEIGPAIGRWTLSATRDPLIIYQSLASVTTPVHSTDADPRLAFVHPSLGRVALYDPFKTTMTPLAKSSIAGAPINDGQSPGMILTTPDGLVYQRLTDLGPREPTRMLAESHVPRATSDPKFPALLIAPVRGQPHRLSLTRVFLPEDAP